MIFSGDQNRTLCYIPKCIHARFFVYVHFESIQPARIIVARQLQFGPNQSSVILHRSDLLLSRLIPGVLPHPELRRFYQITHKVTLMESHQFILGYFPELFLFISFDVLSGPRDNSGKRRFPVQSLKHDGLHDFEQSCAML